MAQSLKSIYKPRNCARCERRLKPKITDETTFNPDSHDLIYANDQTQWFPHYDVEYACESCGHYQHFTHNVDGSLKAMLINKVIFDLELMEFAIVEGRAIRSAGKLPSHVEPFSKDFNRYLDKVLKEAYQEG